MSDKFKTCGQAWQYCKKYGLDNITAAYSFTIAESLLRAYKDGAKQSAAAPDNESPCLECGEPNGKHLPGCKMPKID